MTRRFLFGRYFEVVICSVVAQDCTILCVICSYYCVLPLRSCSWPNTPALIWLLVWSVKLCGDDCLLGDNNPGTQLVGMHFQHARINPESITGCPGSYCETWVFVCLKRHSCRVSGRNWGGWEDFNDSNTTGTTPRNVGFTSSVCFLLLKNVANNISMCYGTHFCYSIIIHNNYWFILNCKWLGNDCSVCRHTCYISDLVVASYPNKLSITYMTKEYTS